jgi:hypothetical protein
MVMKLISGESKKKKINYKDLLSICESNTDIAIGVTVGIAYMKMSSSLHLAAKIGGDPDFIMEGISEANEKLQALADEMGFDCLCLPNYYGTLTPGKCEPGKEGIGAYVFTLKRTTLSVVK